MPSSGYDTNVFVNCPFDAAYQPIFDAIIFAVHDCGFVARCALEEEDSGTVRVAKLYDIIADCGLGIHDISRTEASGESKLPRFNMPLELGVFLGARQYGRPRQRQKRCLILDRERFRYQKYLSDLGGQDIRAHDNDPAKAIRGVRDWLSHAAPPDVTLPGGKKMADRYARFRADLPAILENAGIEADELIYNDYTTFVVAWLRENSWG